MGIGMMTRCRFCPIKYFHTLAVSEMQQHHPKKQLCFIHKNGYSCQLQFNTHTQFSCFSSLTIFQEFQFWEIAPLAITLWQHLGIAEGSFSTRSAPFQNPFDIWLYLLKNRDAYNSFVTSLQCFLLQPCRCCCFFGRIFCPSPELAGFNPVIWKIFLSSKNAPKKLV